MRTIAIYAAAFATLITPSLAFAQDWPSGALAQGFHTSHFGQSQIQRFQQGRNSQSEAVRQWGNVITNNSTVCADGWGRRTPAGSGYCPQGTHPVW